MKLTAKSKNTNELWNAFDNDDIFKFRKLIKDGYDSTHPNSKGCSLIEHILWDGRNLDKNIKFFDELINNNINLKPIIKQKFLLSIAFSNKDMDSIHYVKKLLEFNTGINSFGVGLNRYGSSLGFDPVIFYAISKFHNSGWRNLFNILLEKNPDLEYCDRRGDTVINHSIHYHDMENNYIYSLIDKLIKHGADPTQRNYSDGFNSLHKLCISYETKYPMYKKLISLFLKHGCDINSLTPYCETPLILAVSSYNFHIAKVLIKNGADIDIADQQGKTAIFHSTLIAENTYIFDLLFENNAKLDHISNNGNNILHFLLNADIYKKHFYEKILGKNPELLFMKNKDGKTPIDLAKQIKDEKIKTTLVSLMENITC